MYTLQLGDLGFKVSMVILPQISTRILPFTGIVDRFAACTFYNPIALPRDTIVGRLHVFAQCAIIVNVEP